MTTHPNGHANGHRPVDARSTDTDSRARAKSPAGDAAPPASPWLRLPKETAKAYADFEAYRDLGKDRSLTNAAQVLHKSVPHLGRLSRQYDWVERCRAFDTHNDRARSEQQRADDAAVAEVLRKERQKKQRDALDRQLDTATALLTVARRRLTPPRAMREAAQAGDAAAIQALNDWTPTNDDIRTASAAMDRAVHHQRLAMGLPTNVTRQDIVLQEQVRESADISATVIRLLEEFVCDDCKAAILPHLRRLRERVAAVQDGLVLD